MSETLRCDLRRRLRNLQPFRPCQLGLALVESPELFCFEFEGASYVETVEGAHAEFRAVAARQVSAEIEGVFRYCY